MARSLKENLSNIFFKNKLILGDIQVRIEGEERKIESYLFELLFYFFYLISIDYDKFNLKKAKIEKSKVIHRKSLFPLYIYDEIMSDILL